MIGVSKPNLRRLSLILIVAGRISSGATAQAAQVPTFAHDVAPILFRNCLFCHRDGGIAQHASFTSYETTRPFARAIKEKVLLREMPPWPADPARSVRFRNDPRLSREELEILASWVNAGAPPGDLAELPPMPFFHDGWLHPQGVPPDLIISLPGEFRAPAQGEIPYLRYMAKVPDGGDKWISALQVRPSNPALVHHMAITEMSLQTGVSAKDLGPVQVLARQLGLPSGLSVYRPAITDPSDPAVFDMLGVYTPGTEIELFPSDSGKLFKGGANNYLNFNIHYQPTGKPEKDRSMIGLWFRPDPPRRQLFRVPGAVETIIANGKELLRDTPGVKAEGTRVSIPPIPPYDDKFELIGISAYQEAVTIYQLQPHAHLRGKDFSYRVVFPDGREEVLLTVPHYDFRWQLAYELETPLQIPPGSKMIVTAHYDNSLNNRFNPAPEKAVYFRDQNQSWDEMFTPFVQYGVDRESQKQTDAVSYTTTPLVSVVGCLTHNGSTFWSVVRATDGIRADAASSTSAALAIAQKESLGERTYHLVGADVFNPAAVNGHKVAVRGLLVHGGGEDRINITSLQALALRCTE